MADEAASAPRRPAAGSSPSRFTALELVAAEQLIHLSESSCSSGAPAALSSSNPRGFGFGGGGILVLPASGASAASSSASPRSVNNAPPPPLPPVGAAAAAAVAADEEDDDEQEVGGRRRRNKRYRLIAEIYAATEPPKPIGGRRRKAGRTRTDGAATKELVEARK